MKGKMTESIEDKLDLASKLTHDKRAVLEFRLDSVCPDDGKYGEAADPTRKYLSARAEWMMCAQVQLVLLKTRKLYGPKVQQWHIDELEAAMHKINPLNMALIEGDKDLKINHDQLSVLEEIGRYVSPETKALLHPGTTSYDILDTARSYLFRTAWKEIIRPEIIKAITKLSDLAYWHLNTLQVGRTHLQYTSPVLFGVTLASYARRMSERTEKLDACFDDLRGKISGIVGTGAGIEMVLGEKKSLEFEKDVLNCLDLKPDYTATQIVQKERLADVGNGIVTLALVLADFCNDVRILYGSDVGELTSRDNSERLGGSSADATKDNPISYENMCASSVVIESGMRILYSLIQSDLQRDLRGSKLARYQPQMMMAELYEMFTRLNKALPNLSVNEDRMAENLQKVRDNPSEAMVAILRGEGWVHPEYGVGHDFVKVAGRKAKKEKRKLIDVAMEDEHFREVYGRLTELKQETLKGQLEYYVGSSRKRARANLISSLRAPGALPLNIPYDL